MSKTTSDELLQAAIVKADAARAAFQAQAEAAVAPEVRAVFDAWKARNGLIARIEWRHRGYVVFVKNPTTMIESIPFASRPLVAKTIIKKMSDG